MVAVSSSLVAAVAGMSTSSVSSCRLQGGRDCVRFTSVVPLRTRVGQALPVTLSSKVATVDPLLETCTS